MRKSAQTVVRFVAMLLCFGATPALACPDGYYEKCVIGLCGCLPNSGTVVDQMTRPFSEASVAAGGAAMAAWITSSRSGSIANAQPIPPAIRVALTGFADPTIMDRAHYVVDDHGLLNAAANILHVNPNVAAVTLDDVIVFRTNEDALRNAQLWAHELHHVRQYRDWGILDFSISYVRNSDSVEGPAYKVEDEYVRWSRDVDRRSSRELAAATPVETWPVFASNRCSRDVLMAVRWVPAFGKGEYDSWVLPAGANNTELGGRDHRPIGTWGVGLEVGVQGDDAGVDEWKDNPRRGPEAYKVGGQTVELRETFARSHDKMVFISVSC